MRGEGGVCAIYEVEDGRNLESIKGWLSLRKSLDAKVAHAELCLVDKIIIWREDLKMIRII